MTDTPSLSLAGKKVLVTGASSGIGQAIALAAARAGADVAITYRARRSRAEATAAEIEGIGRRAFVVDLDLDDPLSIERVGPAALDGLGGLDVWINNAGVDILTGPNAALSNIEKLDLLLAADLKGTILASWAAARILGGREDGGVIINMSWDHVVTGMRGTNPEMFAAVKGAVQAFSRSLARSVAPRVRVNVLAPGWIDTAFGESLDTARRQAVADDTPLGRWGTPVDVAGAAVFLASPASSFMTGQTLYIGGGTVMP
jgi:3-oxoacyl-[acyl-carrier protein] reductase